MWQCLLGPAGRRDGGIELHTVEQPQAIRYRGASMCPYVPTKETSCSLTRFLPLSMKRFARKQTIIILPPATQGDLNQTLRRIQ